MKPGSLSRRLALLISLGFAVIWGLSMFVTSIALRGEQDELFNNELMETAHLFRPIVTQALVTGALDVAAVNGALQARGTGDVDEALIYQVLSRDGSVLIQSRDFAQAVLPAGPTMAGFVQTETHAFYTTDFNASGYAVRIGDPLQERLEAYRDSFVAFLIPMLALLPLAYFLVGWVARTALNPLEQLRSEITLRGGMRLDQIDAKDQPLELVAITSTLNNFMGRLAQSLEGERAFASSAAHELRTPLAVALAQVQRLRIETADGDALSAIIKVENALKRMVRLVSRLLEVARAEAGIGVATAKTDIAGVLRFVVDEHKRDLARQMRITLTIEQAPVWSAMDADAFAIVIGNLIDNAFHHGKTEGIVAISLTATRYVSVQNDSALVPAEELQKLVGRLHQGETTHNGFGLGLYIADRIVRQAGSALELRSPCQGRSSGFEAGFVLPPA